MRKDFKIGDSNVPFEYNAYTPFEYRNLIGKDFFLDYGKMMKEQSAYTMMDMAYVGAHAADAEVGTKEEWLSKLELNDLIEALGDIINFLGETRHSESKSKKK